MIEFFFYVWMRNDFVRSDIIEEKASVIELIECWPVMTWPKMT